MTKKIISVSEAKSLGMHRYFTGAPCRNGHIAERWVSNNTCMECSRIKNNYRYSKNNEEMRKKLNDWRAKNPEKVKEWNARSRENNRSSILAGKKAYYERIKLNPDWQAKQREKRAQERDVKSEYDRLYRESNTEKANENAKRWKANNPDKARAIHQKYSARKRTAAITSNEFDYLVMQEAADLLPRREKATGIKWHVDHMIPLQARKACGLHNAFNLQVIPAKLNQSKNNRMIFINPGEWVQFA